MYQNMRQLTFVFTFFVVVTGLQLQAQKTFIDTIWLKNGTAFTGKVQEYKEGKAVHILTKGGIRKKISFRELETIGWSEQSKMFFLDGLPSSEMNPVVYEVLYLNDGSVLKGKIKDIQKGGKLVFELSKGLEMTFEENEIKKIVQETYTPPNGGQRIKPKKNYEFQEKGVYSAAHLAIGNGNLSGNLAVGLGLDYAMGYQFIRQFGVGANVGLGSYAFFDGTDNFFTPSLELRGYLNKKIAAPYYSILAGYGFPFKNKSQNTVEGMPVEETLVREGGPYFHPSIGIRAGAAKGANVVLDLGYAFQTAYFEERLFNNEVLKRDINYRRLTLRVGLVF